MRQGDNRLHPSHQLGHPHHRSRPAPTRSERERARCHGTGALRPTAARRPRQSPRRAAHPPLAEAQGTRSVATIVHRSQKAKRATTDPPPPPTQRGHGAAVQTVLPTGQPVDGRADRPGGPPAGAAGTGPGPAAVDQSDRRSLLPPLSPARHQKRRPSCREESRRP